MHTIILYTVGFLAALILFVKFGLLGAGIWLGSVIIIAIALAKFAPLHEKLSSFEL